MHWENKLQASCLRTKGVGFFILLPLFTSGGLLNCRVSFFPNFFFVHTFHIFILSPLLGLSEKSGDTTRYKTNVLDNYRISKQLINQIIKWIYKHRLHFFKYLKY